MEPVEPSGKLPFNYRGLNDGSKRNAAITIECSKVIRPVFTEFWSWEIQSKVRFQFVFFSTGIDFAIKYGCLWNENCWRQKVSPCSKNSFLHPGSSRWDGSIYPTKTSSEDNWLVFLHPRWLLGIFFHQLREPLTSPRMSWLYHLGGAFKHALIFTPTERKWSNLTHIFVRWVETTNQKKMCMNCIIPVILHISLDWISRAFWGIRGIWYVIFLGWRCPCRHQYSGPKWYCGRWWLTQDAIITTGMTPQFFWFWGPQGKIIHLSLECERVGTHSHLKMIPLKKNTHLPTTWHFH